MDPLLASLQQFRDDGVFNLTGFRTISVRDQIVRAAMVAGALPEWLRCHYGAAGRPPAVLIAGAGVAGMTAAVGLARRGVRVEVLDPAGRRFGLQRRCLKHWLGPDDGRPPEDWSRGRWLDPLQYDWPMEHWARGRFPYNLDPGREAAVIPFRCPACRSSVLADRWEDDMARFATEPAAADLTIHPAKWFLGRYPEQVPDPCGGTPCRPGPLYARVFDDRSPGAAPVYTGEFAAVLLANGAGEERLTLEGSPHFTGLGFWDPDPFEDPTYGGKVGEGRDDVLISGAGDGGLQDLLQVMTRRRSARQSYEELDLDKYGVRLNLAHTMETRVERAGAWANGPPSAFPFKLAGYQAERHAAYEAEADRLLDKEPIRERVVRHVARRPRSTCLVTASTFFDPLYGLNLFLALLIVRALRRDPDPAVRNTMKLALGRPVEAITPRGWGPPPGRLAASECLGRDWDVSLRGVRAPVAANVVILRHGVEALFPITPVRGTRRVFPRPLPPTHLHP